jgi:hypothetical protein
MSQSVDFTSFGKGELSPYVRGRIDTLHYYSSAEKLQNMIVRPYGDVVRRAGTRYVGAVKDGHEEKEVRLIEFVFSTSASYIIEMGEYYLRFYRNDTLTTVDLSAHTLWEAGPKEYVVSDRIIDQITSPTRYFFCKEAHTSEATQIEDGIYDRWDSGGSYVKDDYVNNLGQTYISLIVHIGTAFQSQPGVGTTWRAYWILAPDDSPWAEYYLADGELTSDTAWVLEIETPYTEAQIWDVDYAQKDDVIKLIHQAHDIIELRRYSDNQWEFEQGVIAGAPWADFNDDRKHKLTREDLDVGQTGFLTSNKPFFTANMVGRYVRYGSFNGSGEQGYLLIKVYNGPKSVNAEVIVDPPAHVPVTRWSLNAFYKDNYPAHVTYHESRLVLSNSPVESQKQWFSKSFTYNIFNTGDSQEFGFDLTLNNEKGNAIAWISSGNNLAAGTYGGEFISNSPSDGALNNTNKNARSQSAWGSVFIRPKKIGDRLYFVQRGSRKLREMYYVRDNNNYDASDMTKYSEHITLSGIIDMDYQRNQDSLLWTALSNGGMAIFSRDPEDEIMAWTTWQTVNGDVKSIRFTPNPNGLSDRGTMIVERVIDGSIVKYLESFDNHVVEDDVLQSDRYYADCGVIYSQYDTTEGNDLTITGNTDAEYPDTVGNDLTRTTNPTPHYIAATVGNNATVVHVVGAVYSVDDVNNTFSTGDVGKTMRFINANGITVGTGYVFNFPGTSVPTGVNISITSGTIPTGTITGGFWGFSTEPIVDDGDYFMTADSAYFSGVGTDIGKTINTVDVNGDIVNTFEIMSDADVALKVVGVNWTSGPLVETTFVGGKWDFSTGEFTPVDGYTLESASPYFAIGDIDSLISIIDDTGSIVSLLLITEFTSDTEVTVTLSIGTIDSGVISGGLWALPTTTLDGLEHLEGEIVSISLDGLYLTAGTVVSGAVENTISFLKASVGLPYESIVQTNPLNDQTPSGMAKGKIRRIHSMAIDVYKSLGMDYSSDGVNWFPVGVPEGEDKDVFFTGTIPNLTFEGLLDYTGYIYLRQNKTYPMNLNGIYVRVDISEGK